MLNPNTKKRGALFFTVDTMIAGIVLTLTIIMVVSMSIREPVTQDTYVTVVNYVDYLTKTQMKDFRNQYRYIYDDSNETDPNLYVYQKIYKLQVEGKGVLAQDLVRNITERIESLVPDNFGMRYTIEYASTEYDIYQRSTLRDSHAQTNLTTKLLTHYLDENNTLVGPAITKISIWS